MSTQALEIDSIEWFGYETRVAASRLIVAGSKDDFHQRVSDTLGHPRLEEILRFLALFAYGAALQHHNGCNPVVDKYIGRELRLAEDLSGLPTCIEDNTNTVTTKGDRMKKVQVRWLTDIGGTVSVLNPDGTVFNDRNGVRRGQITWLDEHSAAKYLKAGYVQTGLTGPLGRAFATPMWG
jgi:hypothetical protein